MNDGLVLAGVVCAFVSVALSRFRGIGDPLATFVAVVATVLIAIGVFA